jgi:putative ABC transport system ATP-binding protein
MIEAVPVVRVAGVSHRYAGRPALLFPPIALAARQTAALIGPSGSGKTTLLMLIAGLLSVQHGTIEVAGTAPATLAGAARDRWRGRTIGVVLQSFQLLPRFSVMENLTAAQYLSGAKVDPAAAREALHTLGIVHLAEQRPAHLSRGQAQRAAIARAIVNRPQLILADEPTSSLDDDSAADALRLLLGAVDRLGAGLLIATHDRRVREQVPVTIDLRALQPA